MDPNACIDELYSLIVDEEPDDDEHGSEERADRAGLLARSLVGWLSRGGFVPDPERTLKLAKCLSTMVEGFWEGA